MFDRVRNIGLEQQALYQSLYQQVQSGSYSGGLGSPFATPLSVLVCPSDSGILSPPVVQYPGTSDYYGVSSYRANTTGSAINGDNWGGGEDGVVVNPFNRSGVQITDITDGTSNTILFGEGSNIDPNWPQYAPVVGSTENFPFSLLNSAWTSCKPGVPLIATGYYPLNGNNLPSPPPTDPLTTAFAILSRIETYGSGHTQGANFVFCDGSVHFLSNALNNTAGLLSALSTRAGGEIIDESGL